MTRIKICGITRSEDAEECARLGADFLGLVFVESSPRYVTPEKAAALVQGLGSQRPKIVGVFRNSARDEVARIAARVPIDLVQLHGDESNDAVAAVGLPVIKAIRVGEQLPDTTPFRAAEFLLFDTHDDRRGGGTGRRFDWSLLATYDRAHPFFLAGGITPDNAAAAISAVRPQAIDVSSGVESEPGIKDAANLRLLFERVRPS